MKKISPVILICILWIILGSYPVVCWCSPLPTVYFFIDPRPLQNVFERMI